MFRRVPWISDRVPGKRHGSKNTEMDWKSVPTGHNGRLKCIITEKNEDEYEFYYWATWAKVLSGGFRTSCKVNKEGNLWKFNGTQNLGALGGKFSHEGKATNKEIKATYKAEHGDHGIFILTRP